MIQLKLTKLFPQYKKYDVYGATAALKYDEGPDKHAYRNGLFVLKATGESVFKITNDKKFVPKGF